MEEEGGETRIDQYDPLVAPEPAAWLALDEQARMILVEDYHVRRKIKLPNARIHATVHAIVENQIAEGDALPVREKARRLIAQGLDRHDAIHAIGSVLTAHMFDLSSGKVAGTDPNRRYFSALRRLTAQKWLRSG
jgi:hypothetical protein